MQRSHPLPGQHNATTPCLGILGGDPFLIKGLDAAARINDPSKDGNDLFIVAMHVNSWSNPGKGILKFGLGFQPVSECKDEWQIGEVLSKRFDTDKFGVFSFLRWGSGYHICFHLVFSEPSEPSRLQATRPCSGKILTFNRKLASSKRSRSKGAKVEKRQTWLRPQTAPYDPTSKMSGSTESVNWGQSHIVACSQASDPERHCVPDLGIRMVVHAFKGLAPLADNLATSV